MILYIRGLYLGNWLNSLGFSNFGHVSFSPPIGQFVLVNCQLYLGKNEVNQLIGKTNFEK
jgi:hypothetical protein